MRTIVQATLTVALLLAGPALAQTAPGVRRMAPGP